MSAATLSSKTLSKPSNKRIQLIDTALGLFYQQGIHAVGINEVLAQSGIAKKTLYNHFVSKEALIQACVIERDSRFRGWFENQCSNSTSAVMFVEQVFNALDDWINDRTIDVGEFNGCFFVNTAAEYNNGTSDIYQSCLQHKMNIKQFFEQELTPYITDHQKRHALVDLLLLLKEGVINCAHVMQDKQGALKAKSLALSFL